MKKSFFRIIMFILQIVTICLLIALCIHFNILQFDFDWLTKNKILELINNAYFTNIISTILTALVLYYVQIKYSKHKIKKDFRCNEIINDLYDGIETAFKLTDNSEKIKIKKEQEKTDNTDFNAKRLSNAKRYVDFFTEKKAEFYLSNLSLTYSNNNILIESVQTVFFINLNFKLLNIVNNIKNRRPNLEKLYPEIEKLYGDFNVSDDEKVLELGEKIERYLTDLNFMAKYWLALINYLGYDPLPVKIHIEVFNTYFDTDDKKYSFFRLPLKEQNKLYKKIQKKATMLYIKQKIKSLFKD